MFDIASRINKSRQNRSKSPYKPKLINDLMDSSQDQDNLSNDSSEDQINQQSYDKRSIQTYQSQSKTSTTQLSKNKMIVNNNTNNSANNSRFNTTNNNNNKNIVKTNNDTKDKQNTNNNQIYKILNNNDSRSKNKQKQQTHSPIGINYQSLKLSQYYTNGIKRQQQLYEQNLKQFKQKFNNQNNESNSKCNSKKHNNLNSYQQKEQQIDSLQAMKRSNITCKKLSINGILNNNINTNINKQMKSNQNQTTTNLPLNLTQHLRKNQQFQAQILQFQAQIQQLKLQLKRTKDVIKTLGIKNTDLQKSIQLKNIKIHQLQSQYSQTNSRLTIKHTQFDNNNYGFKNVQVSSQIKQKINQIYMNISNYLKQKVRQFTTEIIKIKMSPLLQQNLQNFLAQIIQLNQITVNKKLGIQTNYNQQIDDNKPIKSTKCNIKTRNPISLDRQNQQFCRHKSETENKFYTNNQYTRQNTFLNSNMNELNNKFKTDVSSNKQNITPNKKINTDEQFKQLQKSLQKLRNMQKQLISTPIPKNNRSILPKIDYNTTHSQIQRNQYSIINRSHISNGNDLERSKSRRKKIFAQTNHK